MDETEVTKEETKKGSLDLSTLLENTTVVGVQVGVTPRTDVSVVVSRDLVGVMRVVPVTVHDTLPGRPPGLSLRALAKVMEEVTHRAPVGLTLPVRVLLWVGGHKPDGRSGRVGHGPRLCGDPPREVVSLPRHRVHSPDIYPHSTTTGTERPSTVVHPKSTPTSVSEQGSSLQSSTHKDPPGSPYPDTLCLGQGVRSPRLHETPLPLPSPTVH